MKKDRNFRLGRSLRYGVAAAALVAFAAPTALCAQEVTYSFDIAAQDLGPALRIYAQQTRQQVVFDEALVRGKHSAAVVGQMTADQGLHALLAGTGMTVDRTPAGVLVVRHLPQGQSAGEFGAGQGPAESASAEGDDREIVVTGSLIRGAAPAGANLIVMDREKLEETGRGSLAEAIQTLPQTHGGGANDATYRSGSGGVYSGTGIVGASSINLRGLGVEETLTLVNGRRLAPAGNYGSFADISVIPFVAVKRVEVLADGASATYGADAMAGVVNIILDDRFEGAETRLRTGIETRSGQPEVQASQAFGWVSDRASALVAGEYVFRDHITDAGRPYVTSDLRAFGGGDYRQDRCSPGNIASPGPLSGAIPANQDGRSLTPDQILRGQTNRCDWRKGANLIGRQERANLFGSFLYRLSDRLRATADAMGSVGTTETAAGYETVTLTVPVSNAYRQLNGLSGSGAPFNESMTVRYLFTEAGQKQNPSKTWSISTNLGLEYELESEWLASLTGGYGRYQNVSRSPVLDYRSAEEGGTLESALISSDLATALNPFGDGANDPDLVASFFVPYKLKNVSSFKSASLKIDGSLLQLPGGSVKAAVGVDFRHETFRTLDGYEYPDTTEHDFSRKGGSRRVWAGFAELYLPIFSDLNEMPGFHRLHASVAGRFDHYSDFGSTLNPKLGLNWSPVPGAAVKGTIGTSFKAPLLADLFGTKHVTFFPYESVGNAPDPDGDGWTNLLMVSGAAADLQPEKGKTWTIGVDIVPVAAPRLVFQLSYFDMKLKGRFGGLTNFTAPFFDPAAYQGISYFPEPDSQLVESFLAAADTVYGTEIPVEAIIVTRTTNFSEQTIKGLDGRASYAWEGLGGTFNIDASASYFLRYRSRLGASVEEVSLISNRGSPARWRGRGGIGWSGNGWGVNAAANYTASYRNSLTDKPHHVRSHLTFDLSLRVDQDWLGNGLSLALHATNIFDKAPPFVDNPDGVGYDGANADPVGRRLALQISKRW